MRIGVPSEVKNVIVESGAGIGSSITDDEFSATGAKMAASHPDVLG